MEILINNYGNEKVRELSLNAIRAIVEQMDGNDSHQLKKDKESIKLLILLAEKTR